MGPNGWVEVEDVGALRWRVVMSGEFDGAECTHLHRVLHELLCVDDAAVELDMAQVEFFGSAGVAAILGAVTDNTMAGSTLTIVAVSSPARRVIELTEMDQLIEMRTDD